MIAVPADGVADVVADARRGRRARRWSWSRPASPRPAPRARPRSARWSAAHAAGLRVVGPNCLGHRQHRPGGTPQRHARARAAGGRAGSASSASPARSASRCSPRPTGAGSACPLRLGRQPRRRLRQRPAAVLAATTRSTDVVLLYLETFGNPRKFARIARRMSRRKPVVAVASATRPPGLAGDLPGPDASAVAALFARSGVIRVDTVAELFDVGVLLASQPLPAGRRVGVVGNASALSAAGRRRLPGAGLTVADGYPRDVGPQAGAHEFADALADAAVDDRGGRAGRGVRAAAARPARRRGRRLRRRAGRASALAGDKPTRGDASWLGQPPAAGARRTRRSRRRSGRWAGSPRTPPGCASRRGADPGCCPASTVGPARLDRVDRPTRPELLAAYGIEVVPSAPAGVSRRGAWPRPPSSGYPVALKAAAAPLRHRLDLGAVRLDLADADEVGRAYAELPAALRRREVLVQPMVAARGGLRGRGGRRPGVRAGGRLRAGRRRHRPARRPGLARRRR